MIETLTHITLLSGAALVCTHTARPLTFVTPEEPRYAAICRGRRRRFGARYAQVQSGQALEDSAGVVC